MCYMGQTVICSAKHIRKLSAQLVIGATGGGDTPVRQQSNQASTIVTE
jgi:hypothetical protein